MKVGRLEGLELAVSCKEGDRGWDIPYEVVSSLAICCIVLIRDIAVLVL